MIIEFAGEEPSVDTPLTTPDRCMQAAIWFVVGVMTGGGITLVMILNLMVRP